jgi:hypothetical protein
MYYPQIIRASKLKACSFFFLNFKGTPSQEEHKTIFSDLKSKKMALSGQSDPRHYLQWSAILSVIFPLTFRSLLIPESQFSQT